MTPLFPPAEYDHRLAAVRAELGRRDIPLALVTSPDNIFYLTGLDHWGYFAPHVLIVPAEGEMVLVTRAMEAVTVGNQVHNARFAGHTDSETAADLVLRELLALGAPERIGIEKWSWGLSPGSAGQLAAGLPKVQWTDISRLVDEIRLVKSPAEQELMRQAARVTDAAATAGIDMIRPGVTEAEIAAACLAAMARAGTYPGFGPFIRSTARLGEEHTSWTGNRLGLGDAVFFELSGCVARYHAPLGRLVHIGAVPEGTHEMAAIAADAFDAVVATLRDGVAACEVYAAWQGVVDRAGLGHYQRHHCGYLVGIGVPPSWTGGNYVLGLRRDSDRIILTGMSFHILSWLMGTGRGDYFISNTVLLGGSGPEVLTRTPTGVTVR